MPALAEAPRLNQEYGTIIDLGRWHLEGTLPFPGELSRSGPFGVIFEHMKKNKHSAIPDFSRAKPLPGAKSAPTAERAPQPNPRQPSKAPTKSKNGGRRGT